MKINLKNNAFDNCEKTKNIKICEKTENESTESVCETNISTKTKILEISRKVEWWLLFFLTIIMGVWTRLHNISKPYKTVWDEVHFGKMINGYLKRQFFFDVHPCGGKLSLTLFGYLGGYNGTHNFTRPGLDYDGYEGILAMRIGCALLGAAMIPVAFIIVWILTKSKTASFFSAIFITCDIGTFTLSKFILLDSQLMLFIMMAFLGLCLIHKHRFQEFSMEWWVVNIFTGLMLGLVISVKFVGVFIILVVGTYTAIHLWSLYSDVSNKLIFVFYHLLAKILTLILIPISVYVTLFIVHDFILESSNVDVVFEHQTPYTEGFQMNLKNGSLYNLTQPHGIAYGSRVSIKSSVPVTSYVSIYNQTLTKKEAGSEDKLILGGFPGRTDTYNLFQILYPNFDPDLDDGMYSGEIDPVLNGDIIRLYHRATNTSISCNKYKALESTKHYIVVGTPNNLTEFDNPPTSESVDFDPFEINATDDEQWQIKVVGGELEQPVNAITDDVQFICRSVNCALTYTLLTASRKGDEPFTISEISCSRNFKSPKTHFHFVRNVNKQLSNTSFDHLKIGFFSRFIETHKVMITINSRLAPPDRNDEDRPWMWPLGIKASIWYDVGFRLLLFINPWVIWLNLAVLLMTPFLLIRHEYLKIRLDDTNSGKNGNTIFAIQWLFLAYLYHYIPFFTMQRILYYHHYFSALQFSSMLTGIVLSDMIKYLTGKIKIKMVKNITAFFMRFFIIFMTFFSFFIYCNVGYGHPTGFVPFNLDNSTFKDYRFFDEWII